MIPTGQVVKDIRPRESRSTTDSSRRTTLTNWQTSGATRSSWELRRSTDSHWRWKFQERAMPHHAWIAKCVAEWLDGLRSQTVTLNCDNEPVILPFVEGAL